MRPPQDGPAQSVRRQVHASWIGRVLIRGAGWGLPFESARNGRLRRIQALLGMNVSQKGLASKGLRNHVLPIESDSRHSSRPRLKPLESRVNENLLAPS